MTHLNTRQVGADYETKAIALLEKEGVRIKEKNFRCRAGEIDLVAADGEYLVFIEVKYRKDKEAGDPTEAVSYAKQKQICLVAEYYLLRNGIPGDRSIRYDVVAICGKEARWYKNAFDHIQRGNV